jgi:signal peptidase I
MRNPVDRLTAGLPRPWRVATDWAVTIIGAIAIVLAVKAWVVNPYHIPTSSMEPTLHCGIPGPGCVAGRSDRVLANRFLYHFTDPGRGDIVVFETPEAARRECDVGGTFVKRIVGLEGELVTIDDGGVVSIDGRRLDESDYLPFDRRAGPGGRWRIPDGHVFVMGDNRDSSCDSRVWGPLDEDQLIGKVFAVYWPLDRIGLP